jgi:hypothetical protein
MKPNVERKKKGVPAPVAAMAATLALACVTLSACTNYRAVKSTALTTGTGVSGPTGTTTTTTSSTFKITSVTIGGGSGGAPNVSVFLESSTSTTAPRLTDRCRIASSGSSTTAKPCVCQFSWQEINSESGSAIPISRTVQTAVTAVQSFLATCAAPSVYNTEIANGTQLRIKLLPAAGNTETFDTNLFAYTKSTTTVSGSFQDAQGRYFDNVLHYSCHEAFRRGMTILSRIEEKSSNDGTARKYPSASRFCLQKAGAGGGAAQSGCEGLPDPEFSAQANYFNLYIRDSERGDINLGNERFTCPKVKEALRSIGTVGTASAFWPLDTSFSLSLGATPDFNIGVTAYTKASKGSNDPTSRSSTCGATASGAAPDTKSLVSSCLGFASKPNADGTCPYFRDSFGQIRFTYRLRRYITTYPPVFDTNGQPLGGQNTDQVYVLDRPVTVPGGDPLKPYTMLGPKPCPFSYFDHKNVVAGDYISTFGGVWDGVNIDGIQFPFTDGLVNSRLSCAAAIPTINAAGTVISIHTANTAGRQYVRPVANWAPHYEEDTDFKACAPQAYPEVKDPPLHFKRHAITGNVSWCSENYPTQNDNVEALERVITPTGPITVAVEQNYTSHRAGNFNAVGALVGTSASATCTRTMPTLPTGYPGAGPAQHLGLDANTCDRTVLNTGNAWNKFPLLSRQTEVESVLEYDSSYQCQVTWDNAGAKSRNKLTPLQGCCGQNVNVWSGIAPQSGKDAVSAHLEPDAPCLSPRY